MQNKNIFIVYISSLAITISCFILSFSPNNVISEGHLCMCINIRIHTHICTHILKITPNLAA